MAFISISPEKRPLVKAISVFLILVSTTSIFLSQCKFKPRSSIRPYEALGYGMAMEVIETSSGQPSQIVIVDDFQQHTESRAFQKQMSLFHETLQKEPAVRILATETLPQQPPYDSQQGAHFTSLRGFGEGMPSEIYFRILKDHPEASVIVSFIGPPILTEEEFAQLPQRLPRMIAYCSHESGLKQHFADRILFQAVVPKKPFPKGKPPRSIENTFQFYYKVVTARDVI